MAAQPTTMAAIGSRGEERFIVAREHVEALVRVLVADCETRPIVEAELACALAFDEMPARLRAVMAANEEDDNG